MKTKQPKLMKKSPGICPAKNLHSTEEKQEHTQDKHIAQVIARLLKGTIRYLRGDWEYSEASLPGKDIPEVRAKTAGTHRSVSSK